MSAVYIAKFVVCFKVHIDSTMFRLHDHFGQKVVCQLTRNVGTHINVPRCRNTRLTNAATYRQLALVRWNINWCKL